MSNNVDQFMLEMKIQNEQFEKGVQQSIKSLQNLKSALNLERSARSFGILGKMVSNFSLKKMAKDLDNIAKKFTLIGRLEQEFKRTIAQWTVGTVEKGVLGIPRQIMEGGKKRAQNIEQAKFQLKGLLKDDFDWDVVKKDLDYAVSGTAYGLDAAAKVASQLKASNIDFGTDMQQALRGISGVAAMTNSSYEDIGHIFTKIAGQGKLMTEELNQFAGRGLNVAATLADKMNITEAQLRELVTKGKIDFKTFATAMNEAFGEQATKANDTFSGALSNVKASLSRMGAQFAEPGYEDVRKVLVALIPVFKDLEKFIKPVSKAFTELADALSRDLVGVLGDIHASFAGMLGLEGADFSNQIKKIDKLFEGVQTSAKKGESSVSLYEKLEAQIKEVNEASSKLIADGKDQALVDKEKDRVLKYYTSRLVEYENEIRDAQDATFGSIKVDEKSKAAVDEKRDSVLKLLSLEKEESGQIKAATQDTRTFGEVLKTTVTSLFKNKDDTVPAVLGADSTAFTESINKVRDTYAEYAKIREDVDNTFVIDKYNDATNKEVEAYVNAARAAEQALGEINKTSAQYIREGRDEVEVTRARRGAINDLLQTLKQYDGVAGFSLSNFIKRDDIAIGDSFAQQVKNVAIAIDDYQNANEEVNNSDKNSASYKKKLVELATSEANIYKTVSKAYDEINKTADKYIKDGKDEVLVNRERNASIAELKNTLSDFDKEHKTSLTIENKSILAKANTKKLYDSASKAVGGLRDKMFDLLGIEKDETGQVGEVKKEYEGLEEVVADVILGKYGNGEERKKKLEELGFSYAVVQNRVNELLGSSKRYEVTAEDEAKMTALLGEEWQSTSAEGKKTESMFDKLVNILAGVGAAVQIVSKFFSALWEHILKPIVKFIAGAVITALSELGKKLVQVNEWLTSTDFFNVKFKWIADGFTSIKKSVADFFGQVKNLDGVKKLQESFEKLKTTLGGIGTKIWDKLTGGLGKLGKDSKKASALDGVLKVVDTLASKLADLFDFITAHENDISDFLANICDGMINFKDVVKNFFGDIFAGKNPFERLFPKDNKGNVADSLLGGFDPKTAAANMVETGKAAAGGFFSGLIESIAGEGTPLRAFIDGVKAIITKLFSNFNWKKGLAIGGIGAIGGVGTLIGKILSSLKKPIDSLKELPGKIVGILGNLGGCLEAYQSNLKADTLMKVAAAIGILAISIAALSFLDESKLLAVGGALGAILLGMGAVMAGLGLYAQAKNKAKELGLVQAASDSAKAAAQSAKDAASSAASSVQKNDPLAPVYVSVAGFIDGMKDALKKAIGLAAMGTFLVALSISVAIIIGCLHLLMGINWKENYEAVLALGAILLTLVATVTFISKYASQFGAGKGLGLIGLSIALTIMVGVVFLLGLIPQDMLIKGVIAMGAIALLMSIAVAISGEKALGVGVACVALAAALLLLIPPLLLFLVLPVPALRKAIIAIGVLLLELAGTAWILGQSKDGAKGAKSLGVFVTALASLIPMIVLLGLMGKTAWSGIGVLTVALIALVGASILLEKFGGEGIEKLASAMTDIVEAIKNLGPAIIALGLSFTVLGAMVEANLPTMVKGLVAFGIALLVLGGIGMLVGPGLQAIAIPMGILAAAIWAFVVAAAVIPGVSDILQVSVGRIGDALGGFGQALGRVFGIGGDSPAEHAIDQYKESLEEMTFLSDETKKELANQMAELKELDGEDYSVGVKNVLAYINSMDLTPSQIQEVLTTAMETMQNDAKEEFVVAFRRVRGMVKQLHLSAEDEADLMKQVEGLASTVKGEFQTKLNNLTTLIGTMVDDPEAAAKLQEQATRAAGAEAVYFTTLNDLKVFLHQAEFSDQAIDTIVAATSEINSNRGEDFYTNISKLDLLVDENSVNMSSHDKARLRIMSRDVIKAGTTSKIALDTLELALGQDGVGLSDDAQKEIMDCVHDAARTAAEGDEEGAKTMVEQLKVSIDENTDLDDDAKARLKALIENAYEAEKEYHSKVNILKVQVGELGWTPKAIADLETLLKNIYDSNTMDPASIEKLWITIQDSDIPPENLLEIYQRISDLINSGDIKEIELRNLKYSLTSNGISEEQAENIMQQVEELEGLTGTEREAKMQIIMDEVTVAAGPGVDGEKAVEDFKKALGIYEDESGDFKTAVVESMVLAVENVEFGEGEGQKKEDYIEKIRNLLKLDGSEIGSVLEELIVTMEKDPSIPDDVLETVRGLGQQLHDTFTSAYSTDLDELLEKEQKMRRRKFVGSFVYDQNSGVYVGNNSPIATGMKKYFKDAEEVTQESMDEYIAWLEKGIEDETINVEDLIASFGNTGMTDEELFNKLFINGNTESGINPMFFREFVGPIVQSYIDGTSEEWKYQASRDEGKFDYMSFLADKFLNTEGEVDFENALAYSDWLDSLIGENEDLVNLILDRAEDNPVSMTDVLTALFSDTDNKADQTTLRNIFGEGVDLFQIIYDSWMESGKSAEEFDNEFTGTGETLAREATDQINEGFATYFVLDKTKRFFVDQLFKTLYPGEEIDNPEEAKAFYKQVDDLFKEMGINIYEIMANGSLGNGKEMTMEDFLGMNPFEVMEHYMSDEELNKLFDQFPDLQQYYKQWLEGGINFPEEEVEEVAETTKETVETAVEEGVESAEPDPQPSKSSFDLGETVNKLLNGSDTESADAQGLLQSMLSSGEIDEGSLADELTSQLDGDAFSSDLFSNLQGLLPTDGEGGVDLLGSLLGGGATDGSGLLEGVVNEAIGGIKEGNLDLEGLKGIGKFSMEGIQEGGLENLGLISDLGDEAGGSLISKVCKVLGIKSPSTVMAGIGSYAMQGLEKGAKLRSTLFTVPVFGKIVKKCIDAINKTLPKFKKAGQDAVAGYGYGISSKSSSVGQAAKSVSKSAEEGFKDRLDEAEDLGKNWAAGLIKGIVSKLADAYKAGKQLAKEVEKGDRAESETKSPSKVAMKLGEYWGEGYIIGISKYVDKAGRAGAAMADSAIDALQNPMKIVQDLLNSDMDMDPVIRPVMDLSDVQNGVGLINGIMPRPNLDLGYVSASMSVKTNPNDDVVSAIVGLANQMNDKPSGDTYNINGVTYDDGSNITSAVATLIRAAKVERRR